MIFDVGSASHPGQTRTNNSDHCSVAQHWVTNAQLAEKGRLFVVADSLGVEATDVDSRHAVNRLYQLYYTYPSNNVRESLQRAISRVGLELYEESIRHQTQKHVMLLAVAVLGAHAYLANVGQTQAYLHHQGRLTQLAPTRPWDEIIPPGDLAESERERTPARVLGWSRVALSDFVHHHLALNDILILCSDGLHQAVSATEIEQLAARAANAQELADQLTNLATESGAEDAATAVTVRATAKGKGGGPLSMVASWALWSALGVAIVAGVVGLLSLASPSSRSQPTATLPRPSPTATGVTNTPSLTLPAILRPTSTPPATATSTRAFTATARPTSASRPTNTPLQATPTSSHTPSLALYDAPRVIAPYTDEPVYQEENNSLVWQWIRPLTAEESFEVRIWKEGTTPPERGSIRTGAQQHRFWLPGEQTGKYFWDVVVVKIAGGQSQPISLRSEPRSFWWMGPRPAQPTNTPVPPTSTPRPTATPMPPTDTPVPPTDTPAPPTDTPVPPTPTPLP